MTGEKSPSWVIEQLNKIAEHVRKQEARMEVEREERERKFLQAAQEASRQLCGMAMGSGSDKTVSFRRQVEKADEPIRTVGYGATPVEGALGKLEATMRDRARTCGEYRNVANVAQDIKGAIDAGALAARLKGDELPPFMREALDMIAHKIARIVVGDPWHVDSWHDIQGYAKLVEDRILQDRGPKRG